MLYKLREWGQQARDPVNNAAGRAADEYRATSDGDDPGVRRAALASLEMFDRLTRRWPKQPFGLVSTIIDAEPIAVTEEVALSLPFANLLHFRREQAPPSPRVLIVPPMAGHFATLVRGTIDALLPQHDVYVCDWTDARDVPVSAGRFDLDDYIDYVMRFLRHLGPGTHALGICQATVPTLAATSLLASAGDEAQPRSLTLMAGPIDGRESPTEVNKFATARPIEWFEQVMIHKVPANFPGAERDVYPGFIQLAAFMGMNPDRHISASLNFYRDLVIGDEAAAEAHRLFYDEYLAVMDMTAEFYLETVRSVFLEFDLARGVMTSRGRKVDPAAITRTALMTVEGERDDICGLGQTEAAQRLAVNVPDSMRRHHVQPGVGHFGVFSGRRWRNEIMPQVREFILEHDRRD